MIMTIYNIKSNNTNQIITGEHSKITIVRLIKLIVLKVIVII